MHVFFLKMYVWGSKSHFRMDKDLKFIPNVHTYFCKECTYFSLKCICGTKSHFGMGE